MNISVKKIEFEQLKQMALDVHNEYYESRAEKAGNFHIELQMSDVPEDILDEWMIALIQDEMVEIQNPDENSLDVKIAVLEEIKKAYPKLKREADRHISVLRLKKQ